MHGLLHDMGFNDSDLQKPLLCPSDGASGNYLFSNRFVAAIQGQGAFLDLLREEPSPELEPAAPSVDVV